MTSISDPSHTGATPPAERELQAQRLVMEHAQKLAHIGHWEFQTDGTIVHASSQVLEIFGFPQGTTPSRDEFRALVPPSELAQVEAAINAIRNGHPSIPVRHRVMRPDGTVRWVDHSFDFRPGEPGDTPVQMGVLKDVTAEVASLDAMRQSAEAIRLSGEAIRESDDRQREALRLARASIWRWDRGTRKIWNSAALFEMLGYESSGEASNPTRALRHPDDLERATLTTEEAIRRREPYTFHSRLAHADGRWLWTEERGSPLFDASGELIAYRGTTQDVDEQFRREEALRESDDRQREALRIARASLWVWDRRTRTLSESDDLYQMLGYAIAPRSFDDRVALRHPDDRESSRQLAEDAIRRREPYTIHYRMTLPAGGWAWIEERGVPQFDEQGALTGYRGTRQDFTEQREAESRIRRSEERLRAVLDSVGDGITLLSLDGRSNWANEAFHRMVGYTSAELDAMEPAVLATTLLDPDTVSDVTRWLRAAAREEGEVALPHSYPMRLHRKDGGVLSAESTLSILREDGSVVGLLSVIRDTTERDTLRAQVEAATLEINQILQTAALPIIVIEEDGAISMANQRTADVFGWTPEELVGQDASILAAGLNPTSHREYIRHYQETGTASGPRGPMIGRTLEVLARHRDGHEFPVEVAVTEMVDPNGRRGYLGVVTDLTERIRAQEELLRMQKSEALGTLVAGVAHDFNNLLTAMVGGIELAKAQPGELRWLNLAQEAADRAIRLVQQLLQFSRRSRTELQDVIPAALVERTTDLMRETFDRRIQLHMELSRVWGVIPGDEGQLQQVVMNLLLNARDAVLERADRGAAGFTPSITVAMGEDRLPSGRAVRIDIQDNGTGMTPEVRARAFDPFFTTKPIDRGTGLGLATVAGIIEHHKGEVSVDSTVDIGTTFTIRLPLVDAPLEGTASEEHSDAPPPSATPTVIVIDDEEMVSAITAGYLEAAGLRVIVMSDGNTAIDRLETASDVDLVITDLNMPSPNGWDILARLHGRPGIPPIVMASGYADEETALERGAAAFLHKPFSQADLVQTVKRLLGRE